MKLLDLRIINQKQREALDAQEPGLPRAILPDLPDIKSHALVISGIRRCGKSTLLRQFANRLNKQYFYFNFDDIRLTEFQQTDYGLLDTLIEESNAAILFFDEIQSAKQWELYIRQKLDERYQIMITGSNASLLSRELGTMLTGRQITRELFPFSYSEFCAYKDVTAGPESLKNYLNKGGFPEYIKNENDEILIQLQSDILYRNIAVRYGIRDVLSLRQLYLYLVTNHSQQISPGKLNQTAGVKSPTTVLEYLSYFEEAYFLNFLHCFAWSAKARSLAPKKVYITDPGFIKTSSVPSGENRGALLENFVYNSIITELASNIKSLEKDVFYFTGKSGHECDFIVSPFTNKPAKPLCIQVCYELTAENQDREISGLLEAMDFFKQDSGTIVTFNSEDLINIQGKTINVIPAWKLS
ncbi:MAG: ATP-binding protein [Treponema sp.]|nr:ATP-binding protein [Treponema sp.]